MFERRGARRGQDARWSLGDEEPPAAHGVALGAGGVSGWWAWKHRGQMRSGIDAVSPATWRGTIDVIVWFAGLAAITVVGSLLVAWPRPVWFVVALVGMVGVGWLWNRRGPRHDVTSG